MPSIRQPANAAAVRYLERHPEPSPDTRPPRDEQRDYWEAGSHPDIVERVWDQLGASLPAECRVVVLGTPALVHPDTGVILALAIGTQYGLRLPAAAWERGLPPGSSTTTTWAGGETIDIQEKLGRDWVFGTWAAEEEAWCRQAFLEWGAAR
jgi:hypothetical protein